MDQERIQQAQLSYQAIQQAEQQLQFILTQEQELQQLDAQIATLDATSGALLLTQLGKGVFMEVQKNTGALFFVDVGAGFYMKKTPQAIKATIATQRSSLKNMEQHTHQTLQVRQQELQQLFEQLQK